MFSNDSDVLMNETMYLKILCIIYDCKNAKRNKYPFQRAKASHAETAPN